MFKGTIRELKKEDVPKVEQIFDLYWSGEFREHLSKRLKDFIESSPDSARQEFKYFVAEENGEVLGVGALRKAPEHMSQYVKTSTPVEFYVLAVKSKGNGVGSALRARRIEEARKLGYTEAVFFSGDTHKDSWKFHDNSDFERVGNATAPNGELGQIWRMLLN